MLELFAPWTGLLCGGLASNLAVRYANVIAPPKGFQAMKVRTLVSHQRYFGMEPLALRHGAGRVMLRVAGLPPERARVSAQRVREDFGMDTVKGDALVHQFVESGLLEPHGERAGDFRVTERFVEYASARIVAPLPRVRAKQLLDQASRVVAQINEEWTRNPLAIDSLAVSGDYMSRHHELSDLTLWVIVRPRARTRVPRWARLPTKQEGAIAIRNELRLLSSFMVVHLVTDRTSLPRPFSIAYQAD